MKLIYFIFIYVHCQSLIAQYKHDYTWTMGYIGSPNDPKNFVLDFNNGKLQTYKYPLNTMFGTVNANISDENGSLLAYTNGCIIVDKKGNLMENGDNLNPGYIQQGTWCEQGYPGGNQSHFYLPQPGNENYIWLFHNSYSESIQYPTSTFLRFSKIDLSKNNGLGKVFEKNVKIVIDSMITYGELSATRHANNVDWWIVSPTARPDTLFRTFLLTERGLQGPFEQRIGKQLDYIYSGGGAFKFNPQGTKMARYGDGGQGVFLYDFDRQTGLLSHFIELDTPKYASLGGAEFSASGRYLYISTRRELFQYDMEASDIGKSVIRIDSLDGFKTWTTVTFGNLQLGPDCRIYVVPTTSVEYFGVIHHPDNRGKDCDFKPHSLLLPSYGRLTRIYYPNYRTGVAPICDSTIRFVTNNTDIKNYLKTISVFPNPAHGELQILLSGTLNIKSQLEFINHLGQTVIKKNLEPSMGSFSLDILNVDPGIYLLKLEDSHGLIGFEKVIIW
ncbi:MAG: T9SS type A sorting domain-containing protein [Saprospiraceae bacterium]|nr:T9SS type A sorting domain-containing protein [Saprospiraceae bacterium]MBK7737677.1 T9SS type A sorting domain-containing protein [Saprospiraceae bacterium]MBK7913739.1 T9SS type A sorting domain-containing protein [Saprospiraceae bacterium]